MTAQGSITMNIPPGANMMTMGPIPGMVATPLPPGWTEHRGEIFLYNLNELKFESED